MEIIPVIDKPDFLHGGGKMGALTRDFNWETSSLGQPGIWPESLRTTLRILLHAASPMALYWGTELVCFYNDAYISFLEGSSKHPAIGKGAAKIWPEQWDSLGATLSQVIASGKPVLIENQPLPHSGSGLPGKGSRTFSYAPAYGENGAVTGVLVTVAENSLSQQQAPTPTAQLLQSVLDSSTAGISVLRAVRDDQGTIADFVYVLANHITERTTAQGVLAGRLYSDVHPGYRAAGIFEDFCSVTEGGVLIERDRHYTGEGFNNWYATQTVKLDDGVVFSFRDITHEVAARSALQASEERFLALVQQSPLSVAVYRGPELAVEAANKTSLQLMGATWEEIEGKPLFTAMPHLEEGLSGIIDKIFNGRKIVQQKEVPLTVFRGGKEELAYFNYTWTPFRHGSEEIAGVMAVGYEVTDQVISRQRIRQSEQRFRAAIDAVEGILWTNDADGRMVGEQPGWASLTGQSFEDYQNYGWANAVHDDDVQPTIQAWEEAVRGRKVFIHAHRLRRSDGAWRHYAVRAVPLLNEQGEISEWVGVHTDITDQLLAQHRIEESQQQLLMSFEQSPVGIATLSCDESLRFQTVNPFYAKLAGRTPAELIGKPLLEALPEIKGQGFEDLLFGVIDTGEAYTANEVAVSLHRGEGLETIYIDLAYQPQRDTDGNIKGILVVATEVTQQVNARKTVEASEAYFRRLTDTVPAIIWLTEEDGSCSFLNKAWYDLTGQSAEEASGFGWLDATHPDDRARAGQLFIEANTDRKPFNCLYRLRTAGGEYRWAVDSGRPKFGADGTYEGMIGTVIDVHEQKLAEDKIRASEAKLRSVFAAAPAAMGLFVGRDLVVEMPNQAFIDIVGKGPDIAGMPLREVMRELITERQPFLEILDDVFTTGQPYVSNAALVKIVRNGVLHDNYYNITYTPIYDEHDRVSAVLDIAIDVTDAVLARKEVEDAEQRLRTVVERAPLPIGIYVGHELRIQFANPTIIDIWGKGSDVVGKLYPELLPELKGTGIVEQLQGVFDTGQPFHATGQRVDLLVDGKQKTFYFNYSFTPLSDASGAVYAVMNTAADVTGMVLAKQQTEEAESALRDAVELAELGTWEVDLRTGNFNYSERFSRWIGKPSDPTSLQSAFAFTTPDYQKILADYMATVLAPGSDGIYDIEHPVVHQETGEVRIIHAQGRVIFDEGGSPIILRGTAQDITPQRNQQELLERQVAERTSELAEANTQLMRSNEELAQYAYVASHDLQEPLRKIRVFSGLLDKREGLDEQSRLLVQKVDAAAKRMDMLIKDLLEFSRLLNSESLVKPLDLNEVCKAVVLDFELNIRERAAQVTVGALPRIQGVALQMNQLFYNLLSNALKFSKSEVAPRIEIGSRPMMPAELREYIASPNAAWLYYDITIKDNGIGFETRYAEQIFEVFKRLHGRDIYPGSGIGLALCRRIALNAKGYLYAESQLDEGTTFHIILPDRLSGSTAKIPVA